MRDTRVRTLVEIALCVALAAVLRRITVWQMPFGGSISLEMLPLFVVALRRGAGAGIAAGLAFGFVDYLMEPFFVHWVQVVLDYPLAFSLCGTAGLFRYVVTGGGVGQDRIRAAAGVVAAALLGGLARFGAHFLSGLVFFAANAPAGQPAWVYSLVYNGAYMLPSTLACAALAVAVVPAVERVVPSTVVGNR